MYEVTFTHIRFKTRLAPSFVDTMSLSVAKSSASRIALHNRGMRSYEPPNARGDFGWMTDDDMNYYKYFLKDGWCYKVNIRMVSQ